MTSAPATTGSEASVLVIARSAEPVTVSVSVAESLPGTGSAMGEDVIVAVFTRFGSGYPADTASVSW